MTMHQTEAGFYVAALPGLASNERTAVARRSRKNTLRQLMRLGLLSCLASFSVLGTAQAETVSVKDKRSAYFEYRRLRDGVSPEILKAGRASLSLALAQALGLPVVGGPWIGLGPAPITGMSRFWSFEQASGRILALARGNAGGPIYLGSADGGVWRSIDGGEHWQPLTDDMPSLAIGALTVHPRENNRIYAGTGEMARCHDCLYGEGIYLSSAGGDPGTWRQVERAMFQGATISAIRAARFTDWVYAATVSKVGTATTGVARSPDLGEHWSLPVNQLNGKDVTDLVIDNSGNLYAAVSARGGACTPADGCGIYYSNTQGMDWTPASNGLPPTTGGRIYKLALAPSTADNPRSQQILFAVISDAATGSVLGVYGTVNGGMQWIQRGSQATLRDCGTFAWYNIYIAVDPTDSNIVYVGLTDIYKTTNAGVSWTNLTNVYRLNFDNRCQTDASIVPAAIHPDQHALLFLDGTIYFGNDGGVYKSTDAGRTFSPAIGNLAITQFYGGALNSDLGTILGGAQDNGTVQTTDAAWTERLDGDGFYTAHDWGNSNLAYAENEYGCTHRSTDRGASFSLATAGMPSADGGVPDGGVDCYGSIDSALFAAPLVMDPRNTNVLYSGHSHLFRSPDRMENWTNVGPDAGTEGISAIAIAPSDTSTIYIADKAARFWVSSNSGTTWNERMGNCPLPPSTCLAPGSYITGLAVDPQFRNIVYAAVNGLQNGRRRHLFKSINGGRTWTDLSTTLPDAPFQAVAIDSIVGFRVYAGTNLGVYISANSGQSWSRLGTQLPNAAVYQLVLSGNGENLYAFTHGRGAWRSADALCPVAPTQDGSVACGTWGATGSLATRREAHTSTLLFDGTVLVTGGVNDDVTASAERYEPTVGSWTSAGTMSTARSDHTATLLDDGTVLVAGGIGAFERLSMAELYDPATNTWTAASDLADARGDHTATALVDGTVLVVGGRGPCCGPPRATAERYDPVTGSWSSAGSMSIGRWFHTATRLVDGTVLVVGGYGGWPTPAALSSGELYDPTTETWTSAGDLAVGRAAHTAVLLTDGTVLVVGGFGSRDLLASAERYDPATRTWSSAGSMAIGRSFFGETLLSGGNVLVVGGVNGDSIPLATAELYDPATNTWSSTGSLGAARGYFTTSLLTDGTVLVAGGFQRTGVILSTAERYHPGTRPPGE